jgi:hypothetical protein
MNIAVINAERVSVRRRARDAVARGPVGLSVASIVILQLSNGCRLIGGGFGSRRRPTVDQTTCSPSRQQRYAHAKRSACDSLYLLAR